MICYKTVDNFAEEDATTLAETRVAESEPDIFIIFHMTIREVLCKTSAERFKEDFKIYESMQPPRLLYNLNASGLGRRPGGIRKDLAQRASVVVEGLDKLRREFNTYKETNSQLQATQLYLATTTATLTTLTNTLNDMNNRLANTQRAILFQAQELSLNRAMMDLKSNVISLRVNLLLEIKRQQMLTLIESLEEEGNRLTVKLSRANTDFNALVQGAAAGQLMSGVSSSEQNTSSAASGTTRSPPVDSGTEPLRIARYILKWGALEPCNDVDIGLEFFLETVGVVIELL